MSIPKQYVKIKKTIGYLNDIPVDLVITYGGLKLIMLPKQDGSEILGYGESIGLAKYVAEKQQQDIKWIE